MTAADEPVEETEGRKKPRRRRKWLILLGVLAVLFLIPILIVGGFLLKLGHDYDSNRQTIQNAMPGDYSGRPAATGAYNVLLLGSDSRAGTKDAKFVEGQRSDTIMLLHVPKSGGQAYVISIMRDTWVNIPGHGDAKINAGLDEGGIPLEVKTIEQTLDTRIDDVAMIDFQGFKDLTDAVGGVTVDVPKGFTNENGVTINSGPQKLDGEKALVFVRERHSFEDQDYQRVRDQRAYLRGLMKTIMTPDTLANPVKLNDVVKKFSPYVSTDDDLTASQLVKIGTKAGPEGFKNMKMFTLPNSGSGWSPDGQQSIVVPDWDQIHKLSAAMKNGTMPDYVKTIKTD